MKIVQIPKQAPSDSNFLYFTTKIHFEILLFIQIKANVQKNIMTVF